MHWNVEWWNAMNLLRRHVTAHEGNGHPRACGWGAFCPAPYIKLSAPWLSGSRKWNLMAPGGFVVQLWMKSRECPRPSGHRSANRQIPGTKREASLLYLCLCVGKSALVNMHLCALYFPFCGWSFFAAVSNTPYVGVTAPMSWHSNTPVHIRRAMKVLITFMPHSHPLRSIYRSYWRIHGIVIHSTTRQHDLFI